jgi:hypothetical protein
MYGSTYDDPTTTRVPNGEVDYLAKAAEQLAKVADEIERRELRYTSSFRDERKQLAEQYATLGAIQRGQLPASLARVLFEQLSGASRA